MIRHQEILHDSSAAHYSDAAALRNNPGSEPYEVTQRMVPQAIPLRK